jgi:dTDP-glucose 4,6-dehydratase
MLVTGGAGFIGCNFVRHTLASDASVRVINLDALTYAGSHANLAGVQATYGSRYQFVQGDVRDAAKVTAVMREERVDTVVHFAAESHVDRSIDSPGAFLDTNVMGTLTMLQAARGAWGSRTDVRFHHVSTDEVYGSLGAEGLFTEETPYDPSSPYSASKAASDHLVRAWARTFGLPVTISNCSNNYGPYQFPEKLIPLMIASAVAGKPLPVYGKGDNIRDWLHVEDHCTAIATIVRKGQNGRTYNVGGQSQKRGEKEWTNLDVVHVMCDLLNTVKPRGDGKSYREQITFVTDRPGHDARYAIDATRIESELGWKPARTFETGLRETIEWYLANGAWIEAINQQKYAGERLGLKK